MTSKFIVEAANRDTGDELQLVVEASDAGHAQQIANACGYLVSAIRLAESDLLPLVANSRESYWRGLPAHLLLLSKFRKGDSPTRYQTADYWETALKEKPTIAIERFIHEALLEPAELSERLSYKLKAPDLKALLKARGQRVSGRKDELIQRLIDLDARAMSELAEDAIVWRCTALGRHLSEEYLEKESAKRQSTEREVLTLLAAGDYASATRVVGRFEEDQVFARGMGIDWKNYNGASEINSLNTIFNAKPLILSGIEESKLRPFRIAAGMMLLWGTGVSRRWLPAECETGIHLDAEAVCRMLVFHASSERRLNELERLDSARARVEWSTAGDDGVCPECTVMSGRVFHIRSARGVLPYAKCTCENGCRCHWGPVFD